MSARSPVANAALRVKHEIHGVVVSAGLMQKTVKVRIGNQQWNSIVNKVRDFVAHIVPERFMLANGAFFIDVFKSQRSSRTRRQLIPP